MHHLSHRVSNELYKKVHILSKINKCTVTKIILEAIEAYTAPHAPDINQYEEGIKAQQKKWTESWEKRYAEIES